MNRLKTRYFARWARKARIADESLVRASEELEEGLYAAELGAGLFKMRIAGKSRGKSSSYRTIVAFRRGDRILYLYGFAKNERDNIASKELEAFKKMSKDYLAMDASDMHRAVSMGILIELG